MIRRLRAWLPYLGGRTQAEESPASGQDCEDEATTALYSCSVCETTFISEEMDVCSKCGESVTKVPSERE